MQCDIYNKRQVPYMLCFKPARVMMWAPNYTLPSSAFNNCLGR